MELIVTADATALSHAAADLVTGIIIGHPRAAIIVATGNTPMGLYGELARRRERDHFDPSAVRLFQLDEYLGVAPGDRRSLYGWMQRSVVGPLGVPTGNVVRLFGESADPDAACRAYEASVAEAGGIDLAILGLGPNGHLGFNEPPSDDTVPTRVVALTAESIASNAAYWGSRDDVPRQALTAGMTVLLAARRVLLLVSGAHKRDILHRTLRGPVTPLVPASYLQRLPQATVLADRAAWPEGTPSS